MSVWVENLDFLCRWQVDGRYMAGYLYIVLGGYLCILGTPSV